MSFFLGDPCPCGWCYDQPDENTRECEKCGRRLMLQPGGYWIQVTPKEEIRDFTRKR